MNTILKVLHRHGIIDPYEYLLASEGKRWPTTNDAIWRTSADVEKGLAQLRFL